MLAEWRIRRVGIDYHVEVEAHFYSVPHRFARAEVEVRFTARTVEMFHKGERIAAHLRGSGDGKHTTVPEHMPSSHRRYADWTIERIRREAAAIGPATAALCELILEHRPHPEQGFRACLGILRLARPRAPAPRSGRERAIEIGARTYGSVKSILDNKLDRRRHATRAADDAPIRHPNIRGPRYYQLGDTPCSPIPPSISSTHSACTAWPRRSARSTDAEAASLGHAEWLALLLDRERRYDATSGCARGCATPSCAIRPAWRTSIIAPPAASTEPLAEAGRGRWIDAHDNLLICGPDRRGQELAGLGARPQGLPRQSLRALSARPQAVRRTGAGPRRRPPSPPHARLGRVELLILDDWGLEPLDAEARHDLLEILEDRYGRRSTIVTSQVPVDHWHALIGDPTYADAILDRLVHNAHRIDLTGESMRRTRKPGRKA